MMPGNNRFGMQQRLSFGMAILSLRVAAHEAKNVRYP